jgi:broad specificity phosphatase PhoE
VHVLLVRHAEARVSVVADARRWSLSEAGRSAAMRLRDELPETGRWVASSEVKAYETLSCARSSASVSITQDARFDEVQREEPFDDAFRDRRRAWIEDRLDERHTGWETSAEAAARFDAGVREHSSGEGPLVVASHGMVITAWLVHVQGAVSGGAAAGQFWSALTFPDIIEVELG